MSVSTSCAATSGPAVKSAVDSWFPSAYACLRDLARKRLEREAPGHTLQPTALLHEAYVRIAEGGTNTWNDRTHFFAVAARVLREVLLDHARRRDALKRGGKWHRVTLTGMGRQTAVGHVDLIALDDALIQLAAVHARSARVVELRYFGGLTVREIAHCLEVSEGTVKLDWRFARAWLKHELEAEL